MALLAPRRPKVRELQRKLWAAAKRSPSRRFHALYDRIFRGDALEEAWRRVRKNKGAAGIDKVTLAAVEERGAERLLAELQRDLREGSYRPSPARRADIPKPQGGFRPRRSATEAKGGLRKGFIGGRVWALDADIRDLFPNIDHELLIEKPGERASGRRVLKLIRRWLKAGVMEEGAYRQTVAGTPQGGVISPLLSNVYLHALDLASLGCHFRARASGRLMERGIRRYCLHRWPSKRAMKSIRAKVKAKTGRNRTGASGIREVIADLNGQADTWTRQWLVGLGLHQLMGTIRYPGVA